MTNQHQDIRGHLLPIEIFSVYQMNRDENLAERGCCDFG